jgi:hypothetical protein
MKTQKQSRTDLLEKKVQALIGVVQQLLDETAYLKEMLLGTSSTIIRQIEDLKKKMAEESSKAEEANTSGKTLE